ncbi:MAG: M50 family metallopeptidase [Elusimicrobiaceae bacterium]|nr:M50 family metallopeptidase [Elusimicrobiaceae bacterium]
MTILNSLWDKLIWLFSWHTLLSIFGVVFALGLVVIVHEWGHFIACRLLGIRVEEFSIGFGKLLKQWKGKKETLFSLRAIPLGGYVKPAGEAYYREVEIKSDDEFAAKPWWARAIMVFAGAGMNYVLAFIIFFFIIFIVGMPVTDPLKVPSVLHEVKADYPAAAAGLLAGDKILQINGKDTQNWKELLVALSDANKEKLPEVAVTYERDGLKNTVNVAFSDNKKLGIMVEPVYEKIGVLRSIAMAGYQCYYWTALSLTTIAEKIYHKEAPDMAGPIGIFELVGKGVHSGVEDYFFLIALISVAIGMFNLFPIPILDGGHIVFFIIEGITGKRPTEKVLNNACTVGAVILISLVLFATYQDIGRLRNKGNKADVEQTQQETQNEQAQENKTEVQND